MDRHEIALERSSKELKLADHMINVTYKLVDDPKLLLTVMHRLFSSLKLSMAAVLYYERMFKRIPPFPEDFESMFNVFKARCTRRYNINIEYITLIQEVREIVREQKNSPVDFSRGGKFVICSENYRLRVISPELLKKYISKAKLFLHEASMMVKANG